MHSTSTEYKQMHNKTISWNDNWILIFICFMGRLILELSDSSSSSFIIASFLIQMLRWIRCSSRFEFFIFLIAWGIFFELWNLYLQLLPSSFLLLWFEHLLVCALPGVFLKVITSFWHTFLELRNPMILGGHSRWLSQLIHYPLLLLPLQVVLLIWDTLVKYDCMVSVFWIFTFFNWFLKVIFWFMFFP